MSEYDDYSDDIDNYKNIQINNNYSDNIINQNNISVDKTTNTEDNNKEIKTEDNKIFGYNPYEFVSKCHKAFVFYDGLNVYCSKCGKQITKIKDSLPINIKYNTNSDNIIISGDMLKNFHNSISRFATDSTYELCENKCPKCNSYMRYLRDYNDKLCFVCSNGNCRYVIT